MSYHHLTQKQHPQIQRLKSRLIDQKQIAVLIAVHPSTISRELRRNQGQRGYYRHRPGRRD